MLTLIGDHHRLSTEAEAVAVISCVAFYLSAYFKSGCDIQGDVESKIAFGIGNINNIWNIICIIQNT